MMSEAYSISTLSKTTQSSFGSRTTQRRRRQARPNRGLRLETIQPIAVAAYIEGLTESRQAPTVKQHLAAIRMLFDWLVTGHVIAVNPAWSVRGPRHVVKKGKTPVLTAAEARQLLDSIETDG